MYITVHTCINKCSWWVFDWHQPSQQWNCDTLYTTISWPYYIIYMYVCISVCVCDVSVCLGSLSLALTTPPRLQGWCACWDALWLVGLGLRRLVGPGTGTSSPREQDPPAECWTFFRFGAVWIWLMLIWFESYMPGIGSGFFMFFSSITMYQVVQ